MGAETLRKAAALMREQEEARKALPKGATRCSRDSHPARPHGHYGYGGVHWCTDFRSPLLDEANMGSRRVYAKPVKATPNAFMLAVADWLDSESIDAQGYANRDVADVDLIFAESLAVARAYLDEETP